MPTRFSPPRVPRDVDHAVVYRREDEFCSWPFTSGFWEDRDGTLIANFMSRTVGYTSGEEVNHDALERGSGSAPKMVTVRSRDRGLTWDGDDPQINMFSGIGRGEGEMVEILPEPVDYLDPGVLVSNGSTGGFAQKTARGTVRISRDGGRSWGPTLVPPLNGLVSTTGVQSTLVRPDGRCLLFMFSVDENNANRRPLVYGSINDGREFHFMNYIVPKEDPWGQTHGNYEGSIRFVGYRWFYPRGYMLPSGRMICVMRCQRDPTGVMWSELFHSDDGGRTWGFLSRVNDYGAPCDLVVMPDGRVVAVYGYCLMPSGIRASVSEDGGRTWGPELIVRDDGGSWDMGYPNAWDAGGGKVGVLYYFNSKNDPVQANGGVRHIQRSIFALD